MHIPLEILIHLVIYFGRRGQSDWISIASGSGTEAFGFPLLELYLLVCGQWIGVDSCAYLLYRCICAEYLLEAPISYSIDLWIEGNWKSLTENKAVRYYYWWHHKFTRIERSNIDSLGEMMLSGHKNQKQPNNLETITICACTVGMNMIPHPEGL